MLQTLDGVKTQKHFSLKIDFRIILLLELVSYKELVIFSDLYANVQIMTLIL